MSFLRIFRTPNPHKFDYRPRHWNPKKEELKERLEEIERIKNGDTESIKNRISGGFRRGASYSTDAETRKKLARKSNIRLLGIIALLALISYLVISVYWAEIIDLLN